MALFRRKHQKPSRDASTADHGGPSAPSREELIIDLRDRAPAPGELVWGMPTRCPECNDFGYLDTVDVERRIMYQHCPSCWAKWEITEAQIEAQNAS
jgi:hypothetical protein